MKRLSNNKVAYIAALAFGLTILAACGDDDSFSPVARDRGYEYAYTSAKDLSKTPCDSMRKGRDAAIGRDKDIYECIFDEQDSIYLWAGDYDTLTAVGREFHRAESSSSSNGDGGSEAAMTSSSSRASSSSRYSSSSSSRAKVYVNPRLTEKGEQFNPDIDYGTMTDPRDGKTYRTVEIRGQIWMAENLNYAGDTQGESLCFNDDEELCDLYGRLYTREAAYADESCHNSSTCTTSDAHSQGICPDGWHIPFKSEVQTLLDFIGDRTEYWSSTKGWDLTLKADPGEDPYGLSFIPGGLDGTSGFEHLDTVAFMWTYSAYQYYLVINAKTDAVFINDYDKYVALPVRCVKGEIESYSSSSSSARSSSSSSARSSSSSARSSSSSMEWEDVKPRLTEKGEQFNPDIEYGTMTDPRDGKTYRTVEVEGVTWMAENLNYTGHEIGKSYCFNDDEEMCELYGRFYSRDAAMNSSKCVFGASCLLGNDTIQGICPDGWHIPTYSETQALETLANKKAQPLMSTIGWGTEDSLYISPGVDTYGLSFVGTGEYSTKDSFNDIGEYAFIWVYYQSPDMYYLLIRGEDNEAFIKSFDKYESNFSVRCVKNR